MLLTVSFILTQCKISIYILTYQAFSPQRRKHVRQREQSVVIFS